MKSQIDVRAARANVITAVHVLTWAAFPPSGHADGSGGCSVASGWTEMSLPSPSDEPVMRVRSVATSYADAQAIYAGTSYGLYVSRDCGANWARMTQDGRLPYDSVGISSVESDDNGRIYLGMGQRPVRVLTEPDLSVYEGRRYRETGEECCPIMSRYVKVAHDGSRAYIQLPYASSRDHGGWMIGEDGARRWHRAAQYGPQAFYAVAARKPDVLYSANRQNVFKSEDGGVTNVWHTQFAPPPPDPEGEAGRGQSARDIAIGGHTGVAWIVTGEHALFRSDGDLTAWTLVGSVPSADTRSNQSLIRVAASQTDPDVAFVVTTDGRLWVYRHAP